MKVKMITNNTFAVCSKFTLDELNLALKHNPESLNLRGEDGKIKFAIIHSDCGGMSRWGITYDSQTPSGNACTFISVEDKGGKEETRRHFAEEFGQAIKNAEEIESNLADVIAEIRENISDTVSSIVEGI